MVTLVNRAKVNTTTTGTGTINLGSAVDGYQTFADAGVVNTNVVRYTIEDGEAWEIGSGTYSSGTLTRSLDESSTGSLLNLSGEAVVYVTATGSDLLQPSDIGSTVQGYDANIVSDASYVHTDNNYTTTEKNKLAGIEAGATADQTKADIDALGIAASTANTLATARNISLTGDVSGSTNFDGSGNVSITAVVADDSHNHVISNVDGLQTALDGKLSTSGKAADSNLLDGIDSSSFSRYDANGTLSNALASGAWVSNYNSSTNVDHVWHDDGANAWNFNSDNAFKSTANSRVNAGSFYAGGNVVWNAGNDGSGSGLDADLLDGYNSSQSASVNTVAVRNASGYLFANYFNGSGTFNTTGATSGMARFTGTNGTDTYGRSYTAAAARTLLNVENGATADQTASEILTKVKTVDGSGSGLDADLLDGIDSVDYSRKVMETASGNNSSANYWAKVATYDITGNYNDGTFLYFFMNEESSTNSAAAIVGVTVRTNNVSSAQSNSVNLSIIGMHGSDPFNDDSFKLLDNGSGTDIELWVKKNSNYDHVSVYEHSAHMEGVSVTYHNNSAWQASEPTGTGNNLKSNGLEYRNYTVWHAGNDGSGSGLDADTLDGVQGSSYLRSDATDTATGVVTFSDRIQAHEIRTNTNQELILNAGESASYATGQTSEYVYVNADSGLQINTSPDNWSSGWAGRDTFTFSSSGMQFPDGSTQTSAGASTGKAIAMAIVFG